MQSCTKLKGLQQSHSVKSIEPYSVTFVCVRTRNWKHVWSCILYSVLYSTSQNYVRNFVSKYFVLVSEKQRFATVPNWLRSWEPIRKCTSSRRHLKGSRNSDNSSFDSFILEIVFFNNRIIEDNFSTETALPSTTLKKHIHTNQYSEFWSKLLALRSRNPLSPHHGRPRWWFF